MSTDVFEKLGWDVQVSCWKQDRVLRVARHLYPSIERSRYLFDTDELLHRFVEPCWTRPIFVCRLKKRVGSGVCSQSVGINTETGGRRGNG